MIIDIIAALLAAPEVVAKVGDRRALKQLKPGATIPGVVYNVVTDIDRPGLELKPGDKAEARVQLNPIAPTVAEVRDLHALIESALNSGHNSVVAGKRVVSCRRVLQGPFDRDPDSGAWTRPADYVLTYYT